MAFANRRQLIAREAARETVYRTLDDFYTWAKKKHPKATHQDIEWAYYNAQKYAMRFRLGDYSNFN